MKRLPAVAVAVLDLVACASPLTAPPTSLQSPSADDRWGPLAVVDTPKRPAALIEGTLDIGQRCAFLIEQGERVLLLWPAQDTRWDEGSRTVMFRRLDNDVVPLRSGEHVTLGGGGWSFDEGGIEWVNEPDHECLTDARWLVSDVEREE